MTLWTNLVIATTLRDDRHGRKQIIYQLTIKQLSLHSLGVFICCEHVTFSRNKTVVLIPSIVVKDEVSSDSAIS
jgi:hypothetical protein